VLSGYDIVCLSTQDWNGLWTRKQRFMQMFARTGNRVLYIETPVHWLGFDVLPADPSRILRFRQGPRRVENNLHIATLPLLLPAFQMFRAVNSLNHRIVRMYVRKWIRSLEFVDPLLWIYTPFSAPLVESVPHRGVVYECVDEFRAARGLVRSSVIGEMEDDLLRRTDVTIVTQENLAPHRATLCKNTFCVPNAADVELFREAAMDSLTPPQDIERLPRPRLGFVGHVHYWLDMKLIRYLATRRPAWSLVFVGPVAPLANTAEVNGLGNVHFLGRRKMEEVPKLVQGMDVCLNPYITGALAEHCSPLKLYEYMAAGKPIVSTEMPEARKFPECVQVAATYEAFLAECDKTVNALPETQETIGQRLRVAAKHSWRNRFADVNEILETHLVQRT